MYSNGNDESSTALSKGECIVLGKSQKKYGPSWFISFVNSQLFIAGDS